MMTSVAGAPGPPGAANSTPIRVLGFVALRRATGRSIDSPAGRDQSMGTRKAAQSTCWFSGQGCHSSRVERSVAAVCPVSARPLGGCVLTSKVATTAAPTTPAALPEPVRMAASL